MSSGESTRVVILKGCHEHFQKSMCDAINWGKFLWGFDNENDINVLRGCRDCIIVLYVTKTFSLRRSAQKKRSSSRGFALIARFVEEVPVPKDEPIEPYWPRETEDNKRYSYRFWIQPLYVSNCFLEKCEVGVEYDKNCFVTEEDIVRSIAEACNIHESIVRNSIMQRGDVYVVDGCIAEKLIDALRSSKVLVEFAPQQKQLVVQGVIAEGKVVTVFSDPILSKLGNASLDIVISVAALFAGKGILLVGPPGSGKTSFLVDLLNRLGIEFSIETGNPEWTPFDTIGGLTVSGKSFVKGFVTVAVEKCYEKVSKEGKPYWLIIDEINRANVDLAFGKLFTLLDPAYRVREKLRLAAVEAGDVAVPEYYVPLSFRLLATMNSFDRAILHKLGYALMRRFAVVRHDDLKRLRDIHNLYSGIGASMYKELDKDECVAELGLDISRVVDELLLKSSDSEIKNDYLVVSPLLHSELSKRRDALFTYANIRLDKVLSCLAVNVNEHLKKFKECEVCPVQLTPGVLADALKYIAVLNTLLDLLGIEGIDEGKRVALTLDTATLFYLLPQVDVLADYARLEALSGRKSSLHIILDAIASAFSERDLVLSGEIVKRLSKGYHIV